MAARDASGAGTANPAETRWTSAAGADDDARVSDFWDNRYSAEEYVYGTEPNDFLAEVAAQLPRGRVLCLADGQGRNGVFLAGRGHAVLSMDQSPVGIASARRLAAERGVTIETQVADLNEFAIEPVAWDVIVSIFVHLPAALRARVARGVLHGLKPGGMFVLEAYAPDQLGRSTGGPTTADMYATLAELQAGYAGLEWLVARELERDVIEGRLHSGKSSVVQMLGRKPA
jgi:SAM-dependent methyltransferase